MTKSKRAKLGAGVLSSEAPTVELEEMKSKRPDRLGRVMMPFWIPLAARKQLKIMGAEVDRTVQDFMTEAMNDLFKKYGKPPIA